jgi:hypothetical protein
MIKALLILFFLVLLGVLTIVTPLTPAYSACIDAASPRAAIEAQKGRWIHLTTDQWEFLRGVYVMSPDTPEGMPAGDRAVLAQIDGKPGGMVFFIDSGQACGAIKIPEELVKVLLEVDASNIIHDGAPM